MGRRPALGLAAAILLAACATPSGIELPTCVGAEREVDEVVVTRPGGLDERPIPIGCVEEIGNSRLRVVFTLPGGPACHQLARVRLDESADRIVLTLVGSVVDDPTAGACAPDERRVVTEVDVAAPIDDRAILDGAPPEG